MNRSFRANREIKKHIKGITRTDLDAPVLVTSVLLKVMAVLLAVMIPITTFGIASNIIFRTPDVYSFEFEKSGAVKQLGIDSTARELGVQVSNFMLHKQNDVKYEIEYNNTSASAFSKIEIAQLKEIRISIDRILVMTIITLALSVAFFVFILRYEEYKYLKYAFRGSIVVFLLIVAFIMIFISSAGVHDKIFEMILDASQNAKSMLPLIFGDSYKLIASLLIGGISLLLYVVIYAIAKRFFRENKMFEIDNLGTD